MEIIIAIVVVLFGVMIYYNRKSGADVNKDGKVDIADVKAAVENTVAGVKAAADANKDGKVDAADASVVVKKVASKAKTAAGRAKKAVAKPKASKTKRS